MPRLVAAWNSGVGGGNSCTTNASGQCSITTNNLKSNVSSATYTVSNITLANGTYDAGANHETDEDSNGTTITVTAP